MPLSRNHDVCGGQLGSIPHRQKTLKDAWRGASTSDQSIQALGWQTKEGIKPSQPMLCGIIGRLASRGFPFRVSCSKTDEDKEISAPLVNPLRLSNTASLRAHLKCTKALNTLVKQ